LGFTLLTPEASAKKRAELLDVTTDGCLMAVMINQSEPKTGRTKTVVEQEEEVITKPWREGRVTLEWHGPKRLTVSYPLASDGRAIVRLHHLATIIRQAGWPRDETGTYPIELVLWQGERRIAYWPVEASLDALRLASDRERPAMLPLERWPTPLIARVLAEDPSPDPHALQSRLIRALLEHGVSVVAPDDVEGMLQREIQNSLQGIVDDRSAVDPGHWLAPNILVVARLNRAMHQVDVVVDVLHIRTREVLAQLTVPAGPTEAAVAVDVALVRTAELFRSIVNSHALRR